MKKVGLNGYVYDFSIDYRYSKIFNEKTWYKIIFELIKKMFIGLLTSLVVNASSHTKCVSLSNQKCKTQLLLIYVLMKTGKNFTTIHLQLN